MSNRRYDRDWVLGERIIHIFGSFACPSGSSGVTASSVKGFGFGYAPLNGVMALKPSASPGITSTPGIAYTSAGLYTVTLEDPYIDAIDWDAHLIIPSGGTFSNAAKIETVPTNLGASGLAPTFTITTLTSGGTPTDFGATYRVGFHIYLRDSSVQFNKP